MYTKKEREQYNQDREKACKRLGITKNQYNWLRRKGEELRKVYENNCNGLYKTEEESNLAEEKLMNKIFSYLIIENLSVRDNLMFVYYQTDPRGATLYLDRVEIPRNNYTQAVCIY